MTAGTTVRVLQLCLIAVPILWHLPAGADDADQKSALRHTASISFQQPQRLTDEAHDRAVLQQMQRLLPARERSKLAAAPLALSAQQAAACALDDRYVCPTSRDDTVLGLQIGFVATHDAALLTGLLPFPATSIAAELTSVGANLSLKAVPPYLRQPLDRAVDPYPARVDGVVTSDGCGIEFELLSAQANYENLFGLVPIAGPYVSVSPFRVAPWYRVGVGPDETRWGFLRNPLLYHANTEVTLRLETPAEVSRWIPEEQRFGEPYSPIDTYADAPQMVYLPIGEHDIRWRSATLISPLFDVIVDGTMAAISIRSELQAIKGGVIASRRAAVVLSDDAASAALSPKSQRRFNRALARFREFVRAAFRRGDGPLGKAIKENARQEATEIIVQEILEKLVDAGVGRLDGDISDAAIARLQGISVPVALAVIGVIRDVYEANYPLEAGRNDIDFVLQTLDANIDDVILGILEAGETLIFAFFSTETTTSTKTQVVTVWDSLPPVITLTGEPRTIEAMDFGGTRFSRARAELMALAQNGSSDNCGRTPEILVDAPDFLPLGENTVTFTFRDRGPNPVDDGKDYAPTFEQTVIVEDTQAPLMLVPQSRVFVETADLPFDAEQVGTAVAIDLADAVPDVSNDAPDTFPLDSRTTVTWKAVDDSGNSTEDTQVISVKSSNTAPVAFDPEPASAITSIPVEITLEGEDPDELDGTRDRLWFEIDDRPEYGEFVAPLYPFFINDFRTRPDGALEGYDPAQGDVPGFIRATYCPTENTDRSVPVEFVNNAEFVQVSDDGTWYVWDTFYECLPFSEQGLSEYERISRWDADGNYQGQISIGAGVNPSEAAFQLDRNGKLYYSSKGFEPEELRLQGCLIDENEKYKDGSYRCTESEFYTFDDDGDGQVGIAGLQYARIDSQRSLAYVYQKSGANVIARIWMYELRANGSTHFIGEIGPRTADGTGVVSDWVDSVPTMVVGTDGSVYLNDESRHRIHKIDPPARGSDGSWQVGAYIGWAGRCDSSTNNACELDNGRSRGYSCTDATCAVDAEAFGPLQGQFNTPRYIAIDPNNVLYVADFENQRVQRLAEDGSFAGEAKSTGTGVNTGDEPSFILGNMGRPASIAVNSSQFFVINRDEMLVDIFGSLPFSDIQPDRVTVKYRSYQDFPNPDPAGQDRFTFYVTDGLAESEPATAVVNVSRNFRPPEALGVETAEEFGCPRLVWRSPDDGCLSIALDEDTSVDFALTSYDPDGIAGEDFLGLDTVRYFIVSPPRHGSMNRTETGWTYEPNENFYGEDRVIFKANDGYLDSEPARLRIEVRPVNDAPVVDIELPDRTAIGFPTLATAVFVDDLSDEYWADAFWGDGTSDGNGELVLEEDEARIDGVAVIPPPQEGFEGRAVASHVYSSEGTNEIRMCIEDAGPLQTCATATVTVEPLVSIAIEGSVDGEPVPGNEDTSEDPDVITMEYEDEFADGESFTVSVTVSNGEREGGGGLVAEDMQLDLVLPEILVTGAITIGQGECTVSGQAVSCTIGAMEPGTDVDFSLTAAGPGNLVYDEYVDIEATLSTASEAIDNDLPLELTVLLIANQADADGDGLSDVFEETWFGTATAGVASGDPDGDGLDNLGEFEAGTSPESGDTDGDGVGDLAEIDAGMDPLVDDNPPTLDIPGNIVVNATGLLTNVELGAAFARDFRDGIRRAFPSDTGPFSPGRNAVTWRAKDASGNEVEKVQVVDVVPLVSFQVDRTVTEGMTVPVVVELNGPAVEYPVIVPYTVSGTANHPDDHDAVSGELRIEAGLSASLDLKVVEDAFAEPDETIVFALGNVTNAVAGSKSSRTITVSELNQPAELRLFLEQQGRTTSTIASAGGLAGILSRVIDDPADHHLFDWSTSDPGLFDPVTASDPAYLLDPSGLGSGLYNLRLAVVDDGVPPLPSVSTSLVRVVPDFPLLSVDVDADGDGLVDADEGAGDTDGDRIPDYLDSGTLPHVLPLDDRARQLETSTGLGLRLGANTFLAGADRAGLVEQALGVDPDNGYPDEVVDFEVFGLVPGGTARVVVPLRYPVPDEAVFRSFVAGSWQDFDLSPEAALTSAPGEAGACPQPGSDRYSAGLNVGDGCLQITMTDGGPNDLDGILDGIIRQAGGLAVPTSADIVNRELKRIRTLEGAGNIAVARFTLRSDSGGTVLRSVTIAASGSGDETLIDNVLLVIDVDDNGRLTPQDVILATGAYTLDDGNLNLPLTEPFDVPPGATAMLVVYELLDEGAQ